LYAAAAFAPAQATEPAQDEDLSGVITCPEGGRQAGRVVPARSHEARL